MALAAYVEAMVEVVAAMVEVVAVELAVVAVVTAVEDLVGETGVFDDHGVLVLHQPQHQRAACLLDLSRFAVEHVGPAALNSAVRINDCEERWSRRYRWPKLLATAAIS